MTRFVNAKRKVFIRPSAEAKSFDQVSRLSKAQMIILERLPLNPRAGAVIAGGQLFSAFRQSLEEGIEHAEYKAALERLIGDGYLEKARNFSYRLTALGERHFNLLARIYPLKA